LTSTRNATTTRALFLELVLDLVIFAFCAAICLQVFGQAHLESARSAALSQLGIEAQGAAEAFRSSGGDVEALAGLPGAQRTDDGIVWYFDQGLEPVAEDEAYFVLSCAVDSSQPVKQARIALSEEGEQLFEYEVKSYQLARGPGGDGS
jgi:hypothetical protein